MDPEVEPAGDPYKANLRLSQVEYRLQHIYLRSQPRCLGLVLSNRCNIGCIHCYQSKNGDNLLQPSEIGQELRREFIGLYPYLSTLRLQGGELFVIPGFRELLNDVAANVDRPIVSISTNGTLIDEDWAERMVRTPFQTVTFSLDGATAATYERLRLGARLDTVLANIDRVQRWKQKLGSPYPVLDCFFVVMRSNFREIPQFLRLMKQHGITRVALQTMEVNRENLSRVPLLAVNESIAVRSDVVELHALVRDCIRSGDYDIQVSGLTSLFQGHGLDGAFLEEGSKGLYPNSEGLLGAEAESRYELCPNPWTTMFITETGDVHLCFLSEAIGNLYQEPPAVIWNSPQALAKRSRMTAGKYVASGCSSQWCSWRDGQRAGVPVGEDRLALINEFEQLRQQASPVKADETAVSTPLAPVRRMLQERDRRIAELEGLFLRLCETNQGIHDRGQAYIDELEAELAAARKEMNTPLVRFARRWSS